MAKGKRRHNEPTAAHTALKVVVGRIMDTDDYTVEYQSGTSARLVNVHDRTRIWIEAEERGFEEEGREE